MPKKYLEKDLQKDTIDYLRLQGFLVVKFNNVGIWNSQTGRYIPPYQKGIADLLCVSPTGRFWALEIKIKPRKPTEDQEEFLTGVRQRNGIAEVIYGIDEIIDLVKKFKDY